MENCEFFTLDEDYRWKILFSLPSRFYRRQNDVRDFSYFRTWIFRCMFVFSRFPNRLGYVVLPSNWWKIFDGFSFFFLLVSHMNLPQNSESYECYVKAVRICDRNFKCLLFFHCQCWRWENVIKSFVTFVLVRCFIEVFTPNKSSVSTESVESNWVHLLLLEWFLESEQCC